MNIFCIAVSVLSEIVSQTHAQLVRVTVHPKALVMGDENQDGCCCDEGGGAQEKMLQDTAREQDLMSALVHVV